MDFCEGPNIKFQENVPSGSHADGRTDGRTDR